MTGVIIWKGRSDDYTLDCFIENAALVATDLNAGECDRRARGYSPFTTIGIFLKFWRSCRLVTLERTLATRYPFKLHRYVGWNTAYATSFNKLVLILYADLAHCTGTFGIIRQLRTSGALKRA
jgi:hypothetical protein